MPASFAPDESTARFETRNAFLIYWPWLVLVGAAVGWALTNVEGMLSGEDAPSPRDRFLAGCGLAVTLCGVVMFLNWRRVKWVRTAKTGGIQWSARGRVWQRGWDQLVRIDLQSIYSERPDGERVLRRQIMTVCFDDGASFRVKSWQCDQYAVLLKYLRAKQEQAAATTKAASRDAARTRSEQAAAAGMTAFGPISLYRGGAEWDGIYYPWDQLEGYAIEHGFLLIRTVDGDEFLRRLVDLGDWRVLVARLDAAAGQMAGSRTATDE